MSDTRGHIELDRAIDSITVGVRHRKDPGDLERAHGVDRTGRPAPAGHDHSRRRARLRVAAAGGRAPARLAHHEGLGPLRHLRQALAPARPAGREPAAQAAERLEKTARLYRELKMLEQEEAERRMQATQFGRPGAMAEPPAPGTARSRAATPELAQRMAITGKASYSTQSGSAHWMDWVPKDDTLAEIRRDARTMPEQDRGGRAGEAAVQRVKEAFELASSRLPRPRTSRTSSPGSAAEALKRVQARGERQGPPRSAEQGQARTDSTAASARST